MQAITRKLILVTSLNEKTIQEMFLLFGKYYDDVTLERFVLDLKEKTHVFMFYPKGSSRLIGFSTIYRKIIPEISSGLFLFSGDTVIHEDFWGSKALQKSFFWFILSSKFRSPLRPVYWMLMSKGVKTYLMMRKNFPYSFPNYLEAMPMVFKNARDAFYTIKFPGAFDAEKGLIRFPEKIGSVKEGTKQASHEALKDPEALFFFKMNPQFQAGEELACICEIRFKDFLYHIIKYFNPLWNHKK
jgi:hypothetical protein